MEKSEIFHKMVGEEDNYYMFCLSSVNITRFDLCERAEAFKFIVYLSMSLHNKETSMNIGFLSHHYQDGNPETAQTEESVSSCH